MMIGVKRLLGVGFAALVFAQASGAATTNYYHLQRNFQKVPTASQPNAYKLWITSKRLTGIVGVTNVVLNTNESRAIEYDALAVGYTNDMDAWNAAKGLLSGSGMVYTGHVYDNVGWVKGALSNYGRCGAAIWFMQNQIAFTSSASSIYVNPNGATSAISSVLVGSLGDYCPQTYVTDFGPAFDTNCPGLGSFTDVVYRTDLQTYYKLVPVSFLSVNNDDSDGDGIPDFADGYNLFDNASEKDFFANWKIELSLAITNVSQAQISISYSASDPASVTYAMNVYTPAPGSYRLWRKQASKSRNKASITSGGDYVPPGIYSATTLGFSENNRLQDFFIEAINPGTNQQIVVEVDPDGGGPSGYACIDRWRSTVLKVDLEAVSDGPPGDDELTDNHEGTVTVSTQGAPDLSGLSLSFNAVPTSIGSLINKMGAGIQFTPTPDPAVWRMSQTYWYGVQPDASCHDNHNAYTISLSVNGSVAAQKGFRVGWPIENPRMEGTMSDQSATVIHAAEAVPGIPNYYRCLIEFGDFAKDGTLLDIPTSDQYADETEKEETYHKWQWLGTVADGEGGQGDCGTAKGIKWMIGWVGDGPWYTYGATPEEAHELAVERVTTGEDNEKAMTASIWNQDRGFLEFQAKDYAGYNAAWTYHCTYEAQYGANPANHHHPAY